MTLTFADVAPGSARLTPHVAPNVHDGTLGVQVPLPLPAGVPPEALELALVYGASEPSSVVGIGWSLSLPSAITRGPRRGVPSWTPIDGFLFQGDELVPWLLDDGSPRATLLDGVARQFWRMSTSPDAMRFEQLRDIETGEVSWRGRDADNVLTHYGDSPESRIEDPDDPTRIAAWLPTFRVDALGRAIELSYVREDLRGVSPELASDRHRLRAGSSQRYLKTIRLGNRVPSGPDGSVPGTNWNFVVVLDYGDHDTDEPSIDPDRDWPARPDPSSNYRAGFEVRTWRRCEAIHVFQLIGGVHERVSTTRLVYAPPVEWETSRLVEVQHVAYRRTAGERREVELPPVRFRYAKPSIDPSAGPRLKISASRHGLASSQTRWVDLQGDGLPGLLTEAGSGWWFSRNLGGGRFDAAVALAERPSARLSALHLGDEDRDGNPDLSTFLGRGAGGFEFDRETQSWSGYRARAQISRSDACTRQSQRIDLDGDGLPDLVISEPEHFLWYPSVGRDHLGPPRRIPKPRGVDHAREIRANSTLSLTFADISGDGLADLVHVENGRVEYWPNLGNGRFGQAVTIDGAPVFATSDSFSVDRLRFVDLTGDGYQDLLYVDGDVLRWWYNVAGNRLRFGGIRRGVPGLDSLTDLQVLEVFGDGRPSLVWSSAAPSVEGIASLCLSGPNAPGNLIEIDDGSGLVVRVAWSNSAQHMLRDLRDGTPWSTHLPQHVTVVDRIEAEDRIARLLTTTTLRYHDGFYDSDAREFRGFGCVDQFDAEVAATDLPTSSSVPRLTRTWFVVGASDERRAACARAWNGEGAPRVQGLASPAIDLNRANRAVAGRPRRVEVFAAPEGIPAKVPLEVEVWTHEVQAVGAEARPEHQPLRVVEREYARWTYEGEPEDPRGARRITVRVDDAGFPTLVANIVHPRAAPNAPGQEQGGISLVEQTLLHRDTSGGFELGVLLETRVLELLGLTPSEATAPRLGLADVTSAVIAPLPHHASEQGSVAARLWRWERTTYWNEARDAALPFGESGTVPFVHHESVAVFDSEWPALAFGERVDAEMLVSEGYRVSEGYWWKDSAVQVWGPDADFAPLAALIRPDGTGSKLYYDDQVLTATTDAVGNHTKAEIDPYVRAPWRITDPNGLVEEVEYDALGVVVRRVRYGSVMEGETEHPWGGKPLQPAPAVTLEGALSAPEDALGACDVATWYELDRPQIGQPARVLTLQRTGLLHDGVGSTQPAAPKVELLYLDGLGQPLQRRCKVAPGNAVLRGEDGTIVVDGSGVPVAGATDDRWWVSGLEVKNRKREVVRVHEAFFSEGPGFEADEALLKLGVWQSFAYDALGRVLRVDHADGTFERTEHKAWSRRVLDRNDNVANSAWGVARSLLPPGSVGRDVYDQTLGHADTPTVFELDPWGRDVQVTSHGKASGDRVRQIRYDGGGREREHVDARGLVAIREERSLDGAVVYRRSIDSGEQWFLSDAFDRPRHRWDSLGYHLEISFDPVDRPAHQHVRGGGLDHQVAKFLYGEALEDGAARNARGRLVETRDGAGRHVVLQYDPAGMSLASEMRLREDVMGEPDWRTPVGLASESFVSTSNYDALGRPVRVNTADGLVREVHWTSLDKMESIALTASDGTLPKTLIFSATEHDASGRPLVRRLGNDVRLDWTYAPDTGRLARQWARLDDSPLQDLRLTHDPVGNVVRVADKIQEPGQSKAIIHGLNTSAASLFRYDPHYRLVEARGRVHRALVRPDDIPGNAFRFSRRLSLNDGSQVERYTRTYTYDAADNLLQMRHVGGSAQWTTKMWVSASSNRSIPERDLLGDIISDPATRFDEGGRLREMDHLRGIKWSWRSTISDALLIDRSGEGKPNDAEFYTYSAESMRVRKVLNRLAYGEIQTTETIYFDGCERRRVWHAGELVLDRWTTHVHTEEGRVAQVHRWLKDDLHSETDDLGTARTHYVLENDQGSALMELDEKGGVICYEEYFPYGGTSFIAGDDVRSIRLRDYRHMGKERDAATGLSYFGYRYFASWIFRWVSPDPAGPIDSLNLFLFLKGNPATLYDASGLNAVRRHYNRQLDRHASQEEVREFARKKGICYGEGPVKWKEASGGYWEIKDSWKCDKEPESRLSDRGTGETLEAKRPADPAGPATPARSVPAPVGVVESTPTELAGSTAGIATPVEADPSTVARSEPGGTSAAGSTGAGKPSEPDASAAKSAGESAQGSGTTESGDDRNGNDARSAGPAITGGEKQLLEMLNSNAIGRAITAALRPLGEAVYSFLSGVADFSMGFITSVGEGFAGSVEMAIGAWNMTVREAYDPEGAGKSRERFEKGVKAIVDDPMAIVHGIVDPIAEDWREGRHAMAAGRVFGEVYDTLLGSKGAGKAGKLGKIGKAGKEVSGELAEGAGRKTGRKGARTASELADEGVSTSGGGARPGRGESLVPSQGHQTGDVSLHGNLTPQRNRAPGHHNVREDGFVQSHHPIQDEWARRYAAEHGLPYNSKDAPALLLRSASGEPHAKLSALQRVRRRRAGGWGTTPRAEFQTAYRELLDAGVSRTTARQAINRAYKYFDNLGWFN